MVIPFFLNFHNFMIFNVFLEIFRFLNIFNIKLALLVMADLAP